ncbi:phage recombination protein Bet [Acetobacter thailandicus]|uniref:Phage recombination protein Bet n=1 Tax=Acetobacter thailandicus TaxID=1502842 RepID=A0ABT3QDA8_9PROT|nr:phage recombination protein Bet [Acetobacter thailandicus]MCX2563283.1 phage recombination protein Bet [Acetobacter thailandicus]NHN94036.1 phage recombination protein Bet [Acetobacter thailandicus]
MTNLVPLNPEQENELINVLRDSLYPGAEDNSIRMVIGYCRAASLDVMKKPVHIVPIWDKSIGRMRDVVMPGISLYRIEASRTGQYIGKSEPEFGPLQNIELGGVRVRFPEWCRMTVRRLVHGRECEFTAKEYWIENYATAKKDTDAPNTMWKKRAYGQLAKCAEAQALRMAFPEQTGGTNTNDEMDGKILGPTIDITPSQTESKTIAANIDHIKIFAERLTKCIHANDVDGLWSKWEMVIQRAEEAGRPIAPEVQSTVFDMIGDKRSEFSEQVAEEQIEEVVA